MEIRKKLLVTLLLIISTQSKPSDNLQWVERWNYHESIMMQRINVVKKWIETAEAEIEEPLAFQSFLDRLKELNTDFHQVIEIWGSETKAKNETFVIQAGEDALYGKEINGIEEIRCLFLRESSGSLLSKILRIFKHYDENKLLCDTGHSPRDLLFSIYSVLVDTELKVFWKGTIVFTTFRERVDKNFNLGQYLKATPLRAVFRFYENYLEKVKEYTRLFTEAMKNVSPGYRACDRGDFVRGETFFELEGAVQYFIPTSHNVDELPGSSCRRIDITNGIEDQYCSEQSCILATERRCLGKIFDCQNTTWGLQACLAMQGPRRYEWLKLRKDHRYSNCSREKSVKMKIFGKIPCVCQCNDNHVNSSSTHLVNLQPVESDVANNMVVTGVRFTVYQAILQFQIQQGILGEYGKVEKTEWKDINDISEKIRAARIGQDLEGEAPGVKENEDFLVLTRYNNSEINFNTLHIDDGYVLTGVKFDYPSPRPQSFTIALLARKFNFTTGKLDLSGEPRIIKSKIPPTQRYQYGRINVDQPTFPTVPRSEPNSYSIIDSSHVEHDGGQTTLPYFDAIPVVSEPPAPLGGFGIFHKTEGSFTGFVSLELVSLNYINYDEKRWPYS